MDDTEVENNVPDYNGLTNVTRSISDAESYAFPETDLAAFQNEDEKEDDFSNLKVKINEFKDTLKIPNGKNDKNSFFYSVCYASVT